ncbi:hypothetical protein B0J13DRAFT_224133 [Dactylonectria estremocensis]|uniref:NACHT-NTPase and P-loop NTPases N-terminal domain-containing protein n=1 Tax=Dactylonectria estremocensis TaxID=1079267 RepID=A0A9P9JEP4_9HYPO|nr:hypothetical protein B0J13DRAFT_224133 [Dactylonectria estremocensis]
MEATAAGIAFLQISTDIVKCVVKIHQLWQEVKNLPEEIKEMLSELEVIGSMFEEIQEQLEADTHSLIRDDAPIRRNLKLATLAHNGLNGMIKDMEKQIGSGKGLKKKTAMVRIIMKKDILEQHQQKLSRTIELLHLAIASHQLALTKRNPEVISKLVTTELMPYLARQNTAKLLADECEEAEFRDKKHGRNSNLISGSRKLVVNRAEYASSKLGKFAWAYTQQTGAWQVYIQWPSWLSESIYEIESNPTFGGWMYNFRTYNVVPDNSEIITRVHKGDRDGVLELFRTRKASPFDRDKDGASLLIYAAKTGHYETCKLLLRMGLDNVLNDTSGGDVLVVTVMETDFAGRRSRNHSQPVNEFHRVAELFNAYLDEPDTTMILRLFNCWSGFADDTWMRTFQKRFLPSLYTGPIRFRLETFRLGSFHMRSATEPLRFLSENANVRPGDVQQSTRERLSLVHSAALALGIRWTDEVLYPGKHVFPLPFVYNDDWSELVRKVASAAGKEDLHVVETVTPWDVYQVPAWRGTPLVSVIGGALCYLSPDTSFAKWDAVLQASIQRWVLDLQAAGVDLIEYGRREVLALRGEIRGALDADAIESSRYQVRHKMPDEMRPNRVREVGYEWNDSHWVPIRLLGLEVGSRPEDWRIEWVPEFEWMAQEFWKLVEKESIVMPGSWIE